MVLVDAQEEIKAERDEALAKAEQLRAQLLLVVRVARKSIKDWRDFEKSASDADIWGNPPGYLSPEYISDASDELAFVLDNLDVNPGGPKGVS